LTAEQKDSLENVQKRAFFIYVERFANRTCSYHEFCREVGSLSLADRREGLSFKFFKKMIRPDSCIHHLIPEKRDGSILSRLRNPSQYSILLNRKRSFVLYALRSFATDISKDFCDSFIDI